MFRNRYYDGADIILGFILLLCAAVIAFALFMGAAAIFGKTTTEREVNGTVVRADPDSTTTMVKSGSSYIPVTTYHCDITVRSEIEGDFDFTKSGKCKGVVEGDFRTIKVKQRSFLFMDWTDISFA